MRTLSPSPAASGPKVVAEPRHGTRGCQLRRAPQGPVRPRLRRHRRLGRPRRAAFGDTKPAPSRYLLAGARVGRPYCSNDHLFLRRSGPTFFTRTGTDDFRREAWSVGVYISVTFV